MQDLLENKWNLAIGYNEYVDLLNTLVSEGKTTGENQSEAMIFHTKMAAQRIRKWEKIFKLSDAHLSVLNPTLKRGKNLGWLMIVEAWCGDVGQNLAPIKKIADEVGIEFRLILRDENLELMDEFLTNGGRSIPKLIAIDLDDYTSVWDWGPRPEVLQKWYFEERNKSDFDYGSTSEEMHLWYAKNRHVEMVNELTEKLKNG